MTDRSHRGRHTVNGMEIRDGSVVTLRGCPQQMVVESFEVDEAKCLWFDIAGGINRFNFPVASLERVSW